MILIRIVFTNRVYEFDTNKPYSYSENESGSNDISLHVIEFSNVHNCDRSSNATQSNLAHKIV